MELRYKLMGTGSLRDFAKAGLHIDTGNNAPDKQLSTCPECSEYRKAPHRHQKCVTVYVKAGNWYCHHCGAKGYVPTEEEIEGRTNREKQLDRLRDSLPDQKKYKRPKWNAECMIQNISIAPNIMPEMKAMLDYCTATRGLSIEVMHRAKVTLEWKDRSIDDHSGKKDKDGRPVRIKKAEPAVCFNYFDHGILINQKYRFIDKEFHFFSGGEVIPYHIDSILRKEVCYITEGEFDALAMMEAGFPETISVPTGGSNTNLKWLDRFVETHFLDKKTIYLAIETDEAGTNMINELLRRLGSGVCRLVTWDEGCKDANDELRAHGVDGIKKCVERAIQPPMEGILTAHTPETEDDLDSMFVNGLSHGASIGIESFDKHLTFETGRYMVVSGRPGDGKSEFVDELVLRLCIRYEWRIAYFSPENVPLKYHLAKLTSKLTGFEFRQGGKMSSELYEKCKDWLDDNVCHIMPENSMADAYTLSEVLNVARDAVQRRGVRICVFDPLNTLVRDREQQSMTDLQWYLHVNNKMLGFAHRYDVLVILVAHPRKVDRSLFDNRRRRVEMNDINGSSEFANKCDFCIVVDRDDDLNVVTIFIDKVKFKNLGSRGQVTLNYDLLSGRYVPCTVEKLTQEQYFSIQGQNMSGTEVFNVNGSYYRKVVDWRNFNQRWIK